MEEVVAEIGLKAEVRDQQYSGAGTIILDNADGDTWVPNPVPIAHGPDGVETTALFYSLLDSGVFRPRELLDAWKKHSLPPPIAPVS